MNTIEEICKEYGIRNYTINSDGSIDVDGNVHLDNKGLTKLPLKFRNVTGGFYCDGNKLTTLEGCPNTVGGHIHCYNNKLITMEGAPTYVGGNFHCDNLKELWNASSDVFKVLHARDNWVIRYNLWTV